MCASGCRHAETAETAADRTHPTPPSARFDQPGEAQEFFAQQRRPAGQTDVPVERYVTALARMEALPQYSTAENRFSPPRAELRHADGSLPAEALGSWTPLGPGNVGGRTRSLVIDPTNPAVIYVGGVAGGVWKTVNGGASWIPQSDLLPRIAIGSLAMDPSNPQVLYAGTGEGTFNLDAVRGLGIWKTTNGGASWLPIAATTTGADFHFVSDLVVSPKNGNRVYAATRTGVFRSLDGGVTWLAIFRPTQQENGCLDLALRTDKPNDILFAACGNFEQGAIFRSLEAESAAVSFTQVLADPGMARASLALAPSNQNVIYALSASFKAGNFEHGLHKVFRSASGGNPGSWKSQNSNTNAKPLNRLLLSNAVFASFVPCGFGGTNQFFNQGWYDNVVAVDPTNPNVVFAGGIDLWRSEDGGKNWGLISFWWATPGSSPFAHADQHVIAFHPQYNGTSNQTVFAANDGGIFRTTNGRAASLKNAAAPCDPSKNKVAWKAFNTGYEVTQFYDGVARPDGVSYFGGTQDNGTIFGADGQRNAWQTGLGGDGGSVAVNDANTVVYAENTGLSFQKSVNSQPFVSKIAGIDTSDSFPFIASFVRDPSNDQRLWLGGSSLYRTVNAAGVWAKASKPLAGSTAPTVSAIAVAPGDGKRVLAGMSNGVIQRNANALATGAGTAWPTAKPRAGFVSSVAYDPQNPNLAYATYSTFGGGPHVWKSTNGGAAWSPLDGTGAGKLPDVPVLSIAVHPFFSNRLFVGTDVGVFSSLDGGTTWNVENTGFANVATPRLIAHVFGGNAVLYAFTHGRGAWRVPL